MNVSRSDRNTKQQRLRRLLEASGRDAIVLSSAEALSWYLDGIRTHVSLAGAPVLAARVSIDDEVLFVAENEADRLIEEELLGEDAGHVIRVPWSEAPAVAAQRVESALREADVAAELRALRASLLPSELARYRDLARDVAEVMTDVSAELDPSVSERGAAARLAAGLVARAIDPLVLLVAGESRIRHRHPLPTGAPLGRRAMLVACGRRGGLIANATRWVGEGGVDDDRIYEVEAAFLAATRPGVRLGDVFRQGVDAYARVGFQADEWRRHHQGGPTGYVGRDPKVTGDEVDVISEMHAFAWNPSAPGAKVEDTIAVSAAGVEVLTCDPRWPVIEVAGLLRPVNRAYGS